MLSKAAAQIMMLLILEEVKRDLSTSDTAGCGGGADVPDGAAPPVSGQDD